MSDTIDDLDYAAERREALWHAKIGLEFADPHGDRKGLFRRQIQLVHAYIALAEAFRGDDHA